MKSKKEKKISVLKRAANYKIHFKSVLQDVGEIDVGGCKINMNFNKEAVVDGCKAVSEYSDTRISLKVDGGLLIFEGDKLYLHSFDSGCAIVRGAFSNINFNR